MKTWRMICGLLTAAAAIPASLQADGDTGAPPAEGKRTESQQFGPFSALTFDRTILQDVKVENGRIYLKRQPNHRHEAITLRNSMANGSAYRNWFNGSTELVSPANAGRPENAWTDWVETTANYVEYWMDGKLILHLHRTHR